VPEISPEARKAIQAYVELLREASSVQMPKDQLWQRLNDLAAELGLDGGQMSEAYVFASLAYAYELGGPEEVERMRHHVLAVGEATRRRN
jgi:hypothetical protein